METISLKKHKEIGELCKTLNDILVKKEVEIANSCKTKKEGELKSLHWREANKSLSGFRNHMEEIMFKEFPDEDEDLSRDIYYGKRKENFE